MDPSGEARSLPPTRGQLPPGRTQSPGRATGARPRGQTPRVIRGQSMRIPANRQTSQPAKPPPSARGRGQIPNPGNNENPRPTLSKRASLSSVQNINTTPAPKPQTPSPPPKPTKPPIDAPLQPQKPLKPPKPMKPQLEIPPIPVKPQLPPKPKPSGNLIATPSKSEAAGPVLSPPDSPIHRGSLALSKVDFSRFSDIMSDSAPKRPNKPEKVEQEEGNQEPLSPDLSKKSMARKGSVKIFSPTSKKKSDVDKAVLERSYSELVVKGGWEKPGEANSLTKKLQREAEKMEREKVEISDKSKSYETENSRLLKWRNMLENIQQQDIEEIKSLEEEVTAASRERDEYAKRVQALEDQCSQLMATLDKTLKDLKMGMKK